MAIDLNKNIDYIRQANEWTPDLGAKLAELLQGHTQAIVNTAQQTNANPIGPPQPPGKINGLNVTAENGHFNVAISDHNDIYRGVSYFVEHADNANFTNPVTEHIGTTRNWSKFLGNTTRYFRAYSAYHTSEPSEAVYHGDSATPLPVSGGGTVPGPPVAVSQGSGTGPAGVGMEGPGKEPWRSPNGAPPQR
jgi:hypothetical protein